MFPEFVSYVDENWMWNMRIIARGNTSCRIEIIKICGNILSYRFKL